MEIIFPVAFVMILPFVALYTKNVTDMNYSQPLIGMLVILNSFVTTCYAPEGMMVIAGGFYKESRIAATIQGVICVVCGLIFGIYYGLSGILWGVIVANAYRVIDLMFFTPKYILRTKVRAYVPNFFKMVFITVASTYILWTFFPFTSDLTLINWIIHSSICVVVAMLLALLGNVLIGGTQVFTVIKGIWQRRKIN